MRRQRPFPRARPDMRTRDDVLRDQCDCRGYVTHATMPFHVRTEECATCGRTKIFDDRAAR